MAQYMVEEPKEGGISTAETKNVNGYPLSIFTDPSKIRAFECTICYAICKDAVGPVDMDDMGLCCELCAQQQHSSAQSIEYQAALFFRRGIANARVKCQSAPKCRWTGKLKDRDKHTQTECEFKPVSCHFARVGCKHVATKSDMRNHENRDAMTEHLKLAVNRIESFESLTTGMKAEIKKKEESIELLKTEMRNEATKKEKKIELLQKEIKNNEENISSLKSEMRKREESVKSEMKKREESVKSEIQAFKREIKNEMRKKEEKNELLKREMQALKLEMRNAIQIKEKKIELLQTEMRNEATKKEKKIELLKTEMRKREESVKSEMKKREESAKSEIQAFKREIKNEMRKKEEENELLKREIQALKLEMRNVILNKDEMRTRIAILMRNEVPQRITLAVHQHRGHWSNDDRRHPSNLLKSDESFYWSKRNSTFSPNESDWITFKIKGDMPSTNITQLRIQNYNSSNGVSLMRISVSRDNNKWTDIAGDIKVKKGRREWQILPINHSLHLDGFKFIKVWLLKNHGCTESFLSKFIIHELEFIGK